MEDIVDEDVVVDKDITAGGTKMLHLVLVQLLIIIIN